MKLNKIQIEQFGVWRNLDLPLDGSRLNVIYGPNEAGKTTLLRFIRGLLYGFESFLSDDEKKHFNANLRSGSILVEQDSQCYEIIRKSNHTGHEVLSVIGGAEDVAGNERLSELLTETDHNIFSHVFAVGLYELQKLATLQDEDVARHLYNATLGSDGEILLAALKDLDQRQSRFINEKDATGLLAELLNRDRELSEEIEACKSMRTTHEERMREYESIEAEIVDLKKRKAGIQYQLRGHQFLEKIWPAWKQVLDLNQELKSFPDLEEFPENGMQRLDQLESELESAIQSRDARTAESEELESSATAIEIDPVFHDSAEMIQSFVSQYDQIAGLSRTVSTLENEADTLNERRQSILHELGPDWSLDQLDAINIASEDHQRIYSAAWKYQSALAKQKRLRSRFQRISNSCQKKMGQLNEFQKQLAGISIEEAVSATQRRLSDLQELSHLRSQCRELEQRRRELNADVNRFQKLTQLPVWASKLLAGLGVSGTVIALTGFLTGLIANGMAGVVFALAGLTGFGVSWGMKSHHRRQLGEQLSDVRYALDQVTSTLCETRLKIDALLTENILHPLFQTSSDQLANDSSESQADSKEAELIGQTVALLVELERWREIDLRIGKRRRRLSQMRFKLQILQRNVSEARQEWCQVLTRIGLPESIQIQETFESWEQILSADALHRQCNDAIEKLDACRQLEQFFRGWITQLNEKISENSDTPDSLNAGNQDLLSILDRWRDQLKLHQTACAERDRFLREMELLKSRLQESRQHLEQLTEHYADFLARGGATDRNEFEERAELAKQQQELVTLLSMAQSELQAVAETEPEMAVVEDNLLEYNTAENSQCIRVLKSELEDLETDSQQTFERLGRDKARIQELESDRRFSNLRLERSLLQEQLLEQTENWLTLQWAGRNLNELKSRFERTRQPATLIAAANYLRQLTNGRYDSIWVPLGEQDLMVDSDQGESFRVDQLSGGTREQLFLSIRFALIEQFRDQGIELPIVLDDVIVNFDRTRAEAVIEMLRKLTETGQQILFFTCHEHLASLFKDQGANLIHLPQHTSAQENRRAG